MVDTFGKNEIFGKSDIAKQSFQNRFKILIIVLTAMFMAVLNTNIVNVALPTITSFYNVPVGLSQWVITGYQVTATVTPLIFAKLSDYTGKSRLFIIGFSVFTVSSLACGLSTSLTELIIFRIVQALGGSMVLSINLAILMQIFPSYEKGRVMGYFTAIIGFGMLMGPTIGGFIIDTMGWAYIFFVNLPIGIALLIPAFKYLKIEEYENKARYEDYLGAILFIISITTFFMVLNEISNAPLNLSSVAFYSAVCALTFLAFILREIRIQKPFLDISIFKIWSFTLPNISLSLLHLHLHPGTYTAILLRGRYELFSSKGWTCCLCNAPGHDDKLTCKWQDLRRFETQRKCMDCGKLCHDWSCSYGHCIHCLRLCIHQSQLYSVTYNLCSCRTLPFHISRP
ncbi:MAG: MFS transporter [Methanobacterium paludis]|nr:MFS transporter [Methanobacterium paludis]